MKFKTLSFFVLVSLVVVGGFFSNVDTVFASCGTYDYAKNPTISSVSPTGTYNDPESISISISGTKSYFCAGFDPEKNSGFGVEERGTSVDYVITNSVGTQMFSGSWSAPFGSPDPLINISNSVDASSWPAGNYTITATANNTTSNPLPYMDEFDNYYGNPQDRDGNPVAPVFNSSNFTITRTSPSATLLVFNATIPSGSSSVSAVAYRCRVFDAPNGYEVTANNPGRSIAVNTSCNNQNRVTTVNFGFTTFFVYSNGAELAQATMEATCESGSAWNESICAPNPTAVNGICSATHYNCTAGTSSNNAENTYDWSWSCDGSGGGTTAQCLQVIPPPTSITASCGAPGTSASISWSLPAGYSQSYFRIRDVTAGGGDIWAYRIPESVSDTGSSTTVPTVAGHTYEAWVHTRISPVSYSQSISRTFTCANSPGGWITPLYSLCTIPNNQSSCTTETISWDTTNPLAGVISQVTSATATPGSASGNSGARTFSVPFGSNWFTLYHNGVEIEQARVDASCASNSDYISGVCRGKPTIFSSAGANGTITPSGSNYVTYGSSNTFTMTPSSGYSVDSVLVNGSRVDPATSYTFNNVTSDQTISVTFIPSVCPNGATNPPTCTICPVGSAIIAGTCTPVTVSVSATTPYNVAPGATVNFAYSPSTNYGSTQCRLLNNSMQVLTAYQASSPISYAIPISEGQFAYYIDCRNSALEFNNITGISNQIIVNALCPVGQDFVTGQCRARLTVTGVAGTGGTITPSSQTVVYGNTADLDVVANPGYTISSVTASGCTVGFRSGTTYRTGAIVSDCTVTASFAINSYSLSVSKTGTGVGTVTSTSSPAQTNISCGATCSASYSYNTAVTLTATPSVGSTFTGWGGDCSGTGSCNVTMSQARNVTATFTANPMGTINATNCNIAIGASTCSSTVSWTTQYLTAGATEITGNNGASPSPFTPSPLVSGSRSVDISNGTTTFFLYHNIGGVPTILNQTTGNATSGTGSCVAGSTWSGSICVAIPVVTVTATPSSVAYNGSSTISWTAPTATSCSYNSSPVGAPSGSFSTGPLTASTPYTIYCNNAAGTGSGSASVSVAGQPSGTLSASPCTIASGGSSCNSTVSWTTANLTAGATDITGNNGASPSPFTPSPLASGSRSVSISNGTTTLFLYHNISGVPTILFQTNVSATCAANTTWNNTICAPNTYTVTANAGVGGTITPPSRTVTHGNNTTFTVTPDSGYSINSVTGCSGSLSVNTYTTGTITADCTVSATFSASPVMSGTLSGSSCVIASGANSCSTTLSWSITNPEGTPTAITASGMTNINVTNTLTAYQSGTQAVTVPGLSRTFYLYNNAKSLVPFPPNGAGVTINATCAVNTTWVNGVCTPDTYTLTVIKSGSGTGTVTSSPAGINCGATCNAPYDYNTAVTLTATPSGGSVFSGWSGDCNASGQVTMSSAKNCTATFTVGAVPNLTASSPTPTTATINVAQTYSSTISNNGNATASGTITHLFQYDNDADHNSGVTNVTTTSSAILAGGTTSVSTSHTFTTPGTRYVRACADNNASFIGTVTESNENDNCSSAEWTSVVVTDLSTPSGTITVTPSCEIAINASTCNSSITWTTQNLTGNPTEVTHNNPDGTHVSWLTSGTNVSTPVKFGLTTFYLYHNSVQLDSSSTDATNATCAVGSTWDVVTGTCKADTSPSGTISATNCTIAIGGSSCSASVSWTTANLTTNPTAITRNSGTPSSFTPSPLSSGSQSVTLGYGINGTTTFYLYHNSVLLDQTDAGTAVATCAVGSTWNGTTCAVNISPSGTITATDCIIPLGGSTCNDTNVTWTTSNLTPQ